MNNRFTLLFFITCFYLSACQSPKEKALAEIKSLENADSLMSKDHLEKVKSAYVDFATKYPDDELAPEFLFKAGQRCNVTGSHDEAITLFQRVIDEYPKHKIAEESLFLQAYVYENSLSDFGAARAAYKRFIEQYPNSDLKEDAELSIKNMGKTPEQIFAEFDLKDTVVAVKP